MSNSGVWKVSSVARRTFLRRSGAACEVEVVLHAVEGHVLDKALNLVVGDVVKRVVGEDRVLRQPVRKVAEVLTLVTAKGGRPSFTHHRDLVCLVVGLDAQSLEDRAANKQWSGTRNNEALDSSLVSTNPDGQVDTPVCLARGVAAEEETLAGPGEKNSSGLTPQSARLLRKFMSVSWQDTTEQAPPSWTPETALTSFKSAGMSVSSRAIIASPWRRRFV